MGRGRPPTGLENLSERPGFLVTPEQREWLESARLAVGEPSLSDWLRRLAIESGQVALGKPFPPRKRQPATKPAKRKRGKA
jgi:hypothetical protein